MATVAPVPTGLSLSEQDRSKAGPQRAALCQEPAQVSRHGSHAKGPLRTCHGNNFESRPASPHLHGSGRWRSEEETWPWVTRLLDPQLLSLPTPDAPSDHQGPLSHWPEGPGAPLEQGWVPPAAPICSVTMLCQTPGSHSHDGSTCLPLQPLVSLEQIHIGLGMLSVQ